MPAARMVTAPMYLAISVNFISQEPFNCGYYLLHRMGDLYATMVVDCLTCLDENSEAFGALAGDALEEGAGSGSDGDMTPEAQGSSWG